VQFLGKVPDAELYALLASCELFVQLDVAEWTIVGYEALVLGKKVLFSVDAEVDPFVRRIGLVYVTHANVCDVARGMAEALIADARPLTAADREAMYAYTWEAYFSGVLDHTARALSARPRKARKQVVSSPGWAGRRP
jgi:hypothetical protein